MAKKNVGVRKIGQSRVFYVTERSARGLVRTGRFDYADAPVRILADVPPAVPTAPAVPVRVTEEGVAIVGDEPEEASDGLEAKSYWELHRMVQQLEEEFRPEGRTKPDYIRALRDAAAR